MVKYVMQTNLSDLMYGEGHLEKSLKKLKAQLKPAVEVSYKVGRVPVGFYCVKSKRVITASREAVYNSRCGWLCDGCGRWVKRKSKSHKNFIFGLREIAIVKSVKGVKHG